MKNLKFKTNINCSGCVANVTPFLTKAEGINNWNVDTNNAQKVLTVETDKLDEAEVIKLVETASYKAEKL